MKLKRLIYIFLTISIFVSCITFKKVNENNYYLRESPPNGIKVNDTLYCDQTENSNLDWLEYMYWTKTVFGSNSIEYNSTLPDTSVWKLEGNCMKSNTQFSIEQAEYYIKHPLYMNYPVVGISQKQALEYSKWRTDRVFENMLIKIGKMNYITNQSKENHFTIEKYFNGFFDSITNGKRLEYYIEFRLPTLKERNLILYYVDSTEKRYFDNCNSTYCKKCKLNYPNFRSDIKPCKNDSFNVEPTAPVYSGCTIKKEETIYNLRGNVSEWTNELNINVGGGWKDKRERILQTDTFHLSTQNAWTGFRNVSEWKKWGK